MTRSIDSAILDNLRASASRGQHAHVIQETFAIDNELLELRLHLLNMRARSYVACAQFAKALETANTMQQMNPASALGYLCQGYIHMEQGRHVAAAHVYDKALEHVDASDPLYGTITTSKDNAIQQGQKRRDFICDLPMDISARIIQELLIVERNDEQFDKQREYVTVSRAWWHRFMASDHLRLVVKDTQPLEETSSIVIEIFSHARSLVFYDVEVPFSQLLEKYRFTSLTSLTFNRLEDDNFIEALDMIGTRFTHLTYGKLPILMEGDKTLRLQHILTMCPNLAYLKCQAAIDISGLQETYPMLRTLELQEVRGTIGNQHMIMMQHHLPGLKILNMAIVNSSRTLTVDDTWLPAIRHLAYGDHPIVYIQRTKYKQHEEQGLVTFSIAPSRHLFALDDIAPLIIHHHATLQLLELKCDLNTMHAMNMADAMHNNLQIEFTRLKKIVAFTISQITNMQPYSIFLTWIVQCCIQAIHHTQ
ncbi:hypothetical protein O0I10_011768 [Lichtheimia ornata]|uniref:Uncharacterized protein n=1 Tax=Lichtheimia ornata TaxID=688661 RepID=A0AAD7UU07_9FUNG|nr:uncharacterized protein O0I10_011768 [Lichtheimia ornata]KAJ8652622.1 hypothetical protein O0I10_011768 [Lichtheimia ornata]